MMPPRDPSDPQHEQSWSEYRRLVLGELERLGRRMEDIHAKCDLTNQSLSQRVDLLQSGQIAELRVDMADLKAKSGLLGGLMGALTALAVTVGSILLKH